MSELTRRFFSGNTLGQALVAAARYFAVDPDALAYRLRDKRHGFIRQQRAVVIEVDPQAPLLAAGAERVGREPTSAKPASGAPPSSRSLPAPRPEAAARPASPRPAASERRPEGRPEVRRSPGATRARTGGDEREVWERPDAEATSAAIEAASRLVRLAGLALEVRSERGEERIELELHGADEGRLATLGSGFLDELEHLLPRAIHGLTGKLVRVRVEGAGLRAARESVLREEARSAAKRVLDSGREELLEPLAPSERRIVHLELEPVAGVRTESLGTGLKKRVRIAPSDPSASDPSASDPSAGEPGARESDDDANDAQFNR